MHGAPNDCPSEMNTCSRMAVRGDLLASGKCTPCPLSMLCRRHVLLKSELVELRNPALGWKGKREGRKERERGKERRGRGREGDGGKREEEKEGGREVEGGKEREGRGKEGRRKERKWTEGGKKRGRRDGGMAPARDDNKSPIVNKLLLIMYNLPQD